MSYLAREDRVSRRKKLENILPDVRSLVVVGLDYAHAANGDFTRSELQNPARGRIAAYAWGEDYHEVMVERIQRLAEILTGNMPSKRSALFRVYVDTGAILERSHAQQAGLGFVGKNTMLIHPQRGSNFFLGVLLTTQQFDCYDTPAPETMCGSCQRCLQACPTSAFPEPFVLDARRCISYLTIEKKGWIARDLRPKIGNWIFGCDICQEICPFQRFAPRECEPLFCAEDINRMAPPLLDLLSLDEQRFAIRFRRTALWRLGLPRLLRNSCVAAGNWGHLAAIPLLEKLLGHDSDMVRGHAAWAIQHILGDEGRDLLLEHWRNEHEERVCEELAALLN